MPDQTLGDVITVIASLVLLFILLIRTKRKHNTTIRA